MLANTLFIGSLYEDYITLENGNIINQWDLPKEYNGLPIERQLKKINCRRLPKNIKIIYHPTGLKLHLCKTGYAILCTEPNCQKLGNLADIKCKIHAKNYSKCEMCPKYPRFGFFLEESFAL